MRARKLSNEKEQLVTEAKAIQIGVPKESMRDFIKEVMKMPGGEKILECIQCGSCAGGCPTIFAMDYSPMQIIKMINLGMKEKVLSSSTIWVCSLCYTCATRCPRNVDFPTLMMSLRNKAIRENLVNNCAKSNFHRYFFEVINKYGRMHVPELFVKLLDITNFNSLLRNVRLGLRLFKTGKLQLRAPKIETSWVSSMLEKTDQE
ncbi:MAG: 4Fe-4S dicluster domain-containing protein [Candidatus Bathyarchaeota archaeon]|nr:MAG: 4Fe-4S dicluster domain-containing protein [Candidatus Bathyarchaeota archaeon]